MQTDENQSNIEEYFLDIKVESIHKALVGQKYKNIYKKEIKDLLTQHSIDQVFTLLKNKYRKSYELQIFYVISFFWISMFSLMYIYINFF